MCGILGSVNTPFDQDTLDIISHRGPDDSGIMSCRTGSHDILLGHRRLSIVDLSNAGAQPMSLQNGTPAIVYNGEIYNHLQLRQQLHNVYYRGHSDTETILNVIASQGINAVRNFNGIFALAFIDLESARIYLVRDRFGVKPLYYRHHGNQLIFCSEIKPLLSLMGDSIDRQSISELLRLRYSPSPDTLFSNIRKVRPGHILDIDLGNEQLRIREYPYLDTCPGQLDITFDEAAERYAELLTSAVNRQLMSDVEVGILLSGGVDSALVAKQAQLSSDYRMKAFTVGFEGKNDADETRDAAETAASIGLDHHCVQISYTNFLETLKECVQIVEEPLATTSIIPMHYLSSLASRHVKVVLSGQGADESLGGYGRYQGELYRALLPSRLARIADTFANAVGIKNERLLRGLRAAGEPDEIRRFARIYDVFNEHEISRLLPGEKPRVEDHIRYYRDILGCDRQRSSVERMMAIDLHMNLSDDLLLYTDKITMHHSLECRVPMLDIDLVNFIQSLPRSYRLKPGKSKILHKAYARTVLPSSMVDRRKKGFLSPTREWFRDGGRLRDILLDRNSGFATYFSLSAVDDVIRQHEQGFNRERQIFLLLTLHYWCEEFA